MLTQYLQKRRKKNLKCHHGCWLAEFTGQQSKLETEPV